MSLDAHDHLWDGSRDKTDISHGKVGEKEVHGGLRVGVQADSQDDEISQYGNQVQGQKEPKAEAEFTDYL